MPMLFTAKRNCDSAAVAIFHVEALCSPPTSATKQPLGKFNR
jgi:hypothetical protein